MNDEQLRQHRLTWCNRVLAWNAQSHNESEQEAAIERAEQDRNRIIGRREPVQQTLTLAA